MLTSHAHSPKVDGQQFHDLRKHLEDTAQRASHFSEAFGCSDWAELAGLWHDLGKYNLEFQKKLYGEKISVEHAGMGAAWAMESGGEAALPLAFVIAGHHAGLANLVDGASTGTSALMSRLKDNKTLLASVRDCIPEDILKKPLPQLPPFLVSQGDLTDARKRSEFWIRFLFSALVDADFLDTEAYYDPDKRDAARQVFSGISELLDRLELELHKKSEAAELTPVNQRRREILDACRSKSAMRRGFFSLTVPTGGGKTLSSMAFALRHAQTHGLRRVITVLPFTSIIEQNAQVYRNVLGVNNVIEHHSNLDREKSIKERGKEITQAHDLAAENWDAPIIVTTTVQFFESLFANKTSRCRKLHNIAQSIIILDEVQTLPPEFLITILDGLKELVAHYNCSVVLSTATPPALKRRANFTDGIVDVEEIIDDPGALARSLVRVKADWSRLAAGPLAWDQIAAEMTREPQALAIVHLRDDARKLAQLLPEEGRFHLSALMCPRHRSKVLAKVREALKNGQPCRLAATSLIEAGVDVSFPVVFRALAGLDSLAQAAGRCNREGELKHKLGRLIVFESEKKPKAGSVPYQGMEKTASMLNARDGELDLNDPAIFEEYFKRLYGTALSDRHGIQADRANLNFATVAEKFKLIDDYSTPIVVPYEGSEAPLKRLHSAGPNREIMRALQQYTVQIPPFAFRLLLQAGGAEELWAGAEIYRLTRTHETYYSEAFGLMIEDGKLLPDPEKLMSS